MERPGRGREEMKEAWMNVEEEAELAEKVEKGKETWKKRKKGN